jgi:hypothetical protein
VAAPTDEAPAEAAEPSLPSPFIKTALEPKTPAALPPSRLAVVEDASSSLSELSPSPPALIAEQQPVPAPLASAAAVPLPPSPIAEVDEEPTMALSPPFVPSSRTVVLSPPFASLPTPPAASAAFAPAFGFSFGGRAAGVAAVSAPRDSLASFSTSEDASTIVDQLPPSSAAMTPSPDKVVAFTKALREPLSPLVGVNGRRVGP